MNAEMTFQRADTPQAFTSFADAFNTNYRRADPADRYHQRIIMHLVMRQD